MAITRLVAIRKFIGSDWNTSPSFPARDVKMVELKEFLADLTNDEKNQFAADAAAALGEELQKK
jgi:hypothetical protein